MAILLEKKKINITLKNLKKNISEPKPQETKKQEDVQKIPSLMDNETKLESVYKKVNNFDHREFLEGAKKAFEIIISSFNN